MDARFSTKSPVQAIAEEGLNWTLIVKALDTSARPCLGYKYTLHISTTYFPICTRSCSFILSIKHWLTQLMRVLGLGTREVMSYLFTWLLVMNLRITKRG